MSAAVGAQLRRRVKQATPTAIAFGFSQALIAVAGLIRVRLLLDAFGVHVYGAITVIASLSQWLFLPGQAIRGAAQARAAEHRISGRAELTPGLRTPAAIGAMACLVIAAAQPAIPPLSAMWRGAGLDGFALLLSTGCLGIAAAASCLAARRVGRFEADGRTAAVNASYALTAVIGLPAVAVAVALGWPVSAVMATLAASLAAPAVSVAVADRVMRSNPPRAKVAGDGRHEWKIVGDMGLIALSSRFAAGADVAVVGVLLSAEQAATCSVAYRIFAFATLLPRALAGYMNVHFVNLRARVSSPTLARKVFVTSAVYGVVSIASGTLLAALGPVVAAVLTGGVVQQPVALYVCLGLVCATGGALAPVQAALNGERGRAFSRTLMSVLGVTNLVMTIVLTPLVGITAPAACTIAANSIALAVAARWIRLTPAVLT